MNFELLNAKIEELNLPISDIAEKIGISNRSLMRKLKGKSDFKVSEMNRISTILKLTDTERSLIFFSDNGDKNDIK